MSTAMPTSPRSPAPNMTSTMGAPPQTPKSKSRGPSMYGPVTPTTMAESWRLVDGDFESFDAHFLPETTSPHKLGGGTPSFRSSASFPTSDEGLDMSQRTVEFTEDERAFRDLREPMEPTLTPGRRRLLRAEEVTRGYDDQPMTPRRGDDGLRENQIRYRQKQQQRHQCAMPDYENAELDHNHDCDEDYTHASSPPRRRSQNTQATKALLQDVLPGFILETLTWTLGLIGHALRFVQKPLAALLAVYLFASGLVFLQSILTNSLVSTLSPLCRVPGISSLDVCSSPLINKNGILAQVEFESLMSVQGKFEHVLEKSSSGVSLPLEMKQSEMAVRDLRALVHYSDLPARDEIVTHFDGYIDMARKTARHLQLFNTHVGTAVDAVISINRWTLRFLDSARSVEGSNGFDNGFGGVDGGQARNSVVKALMMPIEIVVGGVPAHRFSEAVLLEKYIEHTAYVSDHIARLIVEAQYVLGLLTSAEDHLLLIYAVASREERTVASQRDAVKWSLRTLIGANNKALHGFDEQLALLRRVDNQRSQAVAQVLELIVELESMQASLETLRDRVAAPELAQQTMGGAKIPLQVHIDTIERGIERLNMARGRIRSADNEKMQQVLEHGGTVGRMSEADSHIAVAM
ncbi:hypothetical protein HOO65_010634 [Ceratocystis lukuohia]|uniref:Uncharacterized protein n=2 Tax=Ceratocystis TaxID=5157 RepID=A0A2C5XH33_9PEZI|nr:hypothetical protein CFIMG_008499RA00001 [Ceratocystis fimbriata CBS 114723]